MSKLILILAVLLALVLPAGAGAHKTHLSLSEAHRLIVRAVGPGTVVGTCQRRSARQIDCAYSTPASNVFEGEGIESWTWESFVMVEGRYVRFP